MAEGGGAHARREELHKTPGYRQDQSRGGKVLEDEDTLLKEKTFR